MHARVSSLSSKLFLRLGLILLLCLFFMTVVAPSAMAEGGDEAADPSDPVTPLVLDIDLSTLPPMDPWQPGDPIIDLPLLEDPPTAPESSALDSPSAHPENTSKKAALPDAIDTVVPPEFSNPDVSFDGIPFTGFRPPDTVGDVGPNHYVQMVNAAFQIFDKQGNSLAGPNNINTLWTGAGATGACANNNRGDPIVIYDHLADRWVLSQFALPGGWAPPNFECIAISQGPNPVTDGWYLYTFQLNFEPDYPKLGLWPDGYYMSTQRGFPGGGLDVTVFDRANMLNGNPAMMITRNVAAPSVVLLPSDLDGPPPPRGTPNYFVRQMDNARFGGLDRVEIYAFTTNWQNPAASTFAQVAGLRTVPFDSILCANNLGDACVPQPGTGQRLDTLSPWPMWRAQYRGRSIVFNHTVDADGTGHAGIRWYELRQTGGGGWSIFQQGTYSPDNATNGQPIPGQPGLADDPHRWMGSIAKDRQGNMALGFSVSDGNALFPGIRYVGRLATDPLGLMPQGQGADGDNLIMAGAGSQTGSNRWGDYSSMNVDPVDDCTFWYTSEYMPASGNWQTRVASFRFPSCNPVILSVTKEDSPDPVNAGEELIYTIQYANRGSTATNVVLTDTLPLGVTYISDTDNCVLNGGTGPGGADQLVCDLGDLPPGSSGDFRIKVRVDSDFLAIYGTSATLLNEVVINADQEDPWLADNTATENTIVNESADLRVSKDCKPEGPAVAGGPKAICTIEVENLGPSTARSVGIIDTHISDGYFAIGAPTTTAGSCSITGPNPQPLSGEVACDLGDLDAGASATIRVPVSAVETRDINDRAVATSLTPDPDLANNVGEDTVHYEARADVGVSKTAVTSPIDPGATASWTISVINAGPSVATNVQIIDILPAGILEDTVVVSGAACTAGTPGDPADPTVCNLGNMAKDASVDVTISGQVDPNYVGAPGILNDVVVETDTVDPNGDNNRATAGIAINSAGELAIFKQSQPSTVKAGEIVDYVIDVSIGVPPTAINVVVSDTLPIEVLFNSVEVVGGNGTECSYAPGARLVTCILGDMQPGTNKQILIHGQIDPNAPEGMIENTAEVTADNADTMEWSAKTVIVTEVGLSALKRSSSLSPATGEIFTYEVEVTNHGPSVARDVVVEDEVTGSVDYLYSRGVECTNAGNDVTCELGDMGVGETIKFELVVQVEPDVKDGHESDNVVKVSSTTDGANGQPAMTEAYMETIVFRNLHDLKIRKFGKPDGEAEAGDKLVYTILVDNFGPGVAYDVKVTDLMASNGSYTYEASGCKPASGSGTGNVEITCGRSKLWPGDQWSIALTVTADEPQTINNTADVQAKGTDLDYSNNSAIVEHGIDAVANLEVTKTVDKERVDAGGKLLYTIKVKNRGPSTADNVRIIDTLPAGVTVLSVDKPDNCTLDLSTCVVSHLNDGESFTVNVEVQVDPDLAEDAELVNAVSVVSDAFDDQMSNNTTSVKSTVKVDERLHVVKASAAAAVYAGDELIYTIDVANVGKSTVKNVEIRDVLPDEVTYVGYETTSADGICIQTGVVLCRLGDMDPDESHVIAITVRVDPKTPKGDIRNELQATSRWYSGTWWAETEVLVDRSYRMEYSASVASAEPGDFLFYVVNVISEGLSTIRNIEVTVTLPDVLKYVDDTISCGPTLTDCELGDLPPGEERSFQVIVQVDPDAETTGQVVSTASASASTPSGTETAENSAILIVTDGDTAVPMLFLPMISNK